MFTSKDFMNITQYSRTDKTSNVDRRWARRIRLTLIGGQLTHHRVVLPANLKVPGIFQKSADRIYAYGYYYNGTVALFPYP